MGLFYSLCEEARSAVDVLGAGGCYAKSLEKYSKKTGLSKDGLWSAVESVLNNGNRGKELKRLLKTYGGTADQWNDWLEIVSKKPDCPQAVSRG